MQHLASVDSAEKGFQASLSALIYLLQNHEEKHAAVVAALNGVLSVPRKQVWAQTYTTSASHLGLVKSLHLSKQQVPFLIGLHLTKVHKALSVYIPPNTCQCLSNVYLCLFHA